MAEAKTMEVFKGIRDAQQKLDYFLLGLATALFAYIGGKYEPQAISLSENTFELAAIVLIFVSILFGFIRINNHITIMQLNHQTLEMSDTRGTIVEAYSVHGRVLTKDMGKVTSPQEASIILDVIDKNHLKAKSDMDKMVSRSVVYYNLRNWFLVLGFCALVSSKLYGVYIASQGV